MRAFLFAAALLLVPGVAMAQDADPNSNPNSNPNPNPKPEPKPLLPPADTSTNTSSNGAIGGPPQQQQQEDDPTPIRLSAIISEAASVQRRARIAEGVLGIIAGGGGIASGAVLLTLNTGQGDGPKIIGGVAMGFGGLTILTSVFDLFSRGALERLDEAYAPIAHDKSIPAAKRLAEGENALESLASSGRSSRIFSGVTSIVLGVGFGIAAAPIAFAAVPDTTQDASTIRAYLGFGFGLSAFLMVASGVTTIVVKRTEAEQLWNLWLAGTGRSTAKNGITPFLTSSGVGIHF